MRSIPLFNLVQRDLDKSVSDGAVLELQCCLPNAVASPVWDGIYPEVVIGNTYKDTEENFVSDIWFKE